MCGHFSKLTMRTPERCRWRLSNVFTINFEHVSHISTASIVEFEQVNVSWVFNNIIF